MTAATLFCPLNKQLKISFWIIAIALTAGLILSFLSWLELCVEHCSVNQNYRLFKLPFAIVGMSFFSVLLILHLLSRKSPPLSQTVKWMIASALGSEIVFLFVQKYQIGRWCPVCLSIALCVAIAAATKAGCHLISYLSTTQKNNGGIAMHILKKSFMSFSFFTFGLFMAFIGISKIDPAQAAVNEVQDRLVFGKKGSPIEMYFISDWFCPSCKKVEPLIERLYPQLQSQASIYFVDYPIHRKSMNFTPYNLSFLIHNKPQYFQARNMLLELTDQTDSPKDEDIAKATKNLNISFKELPFVDIKTGMEYFDKVTDKYGINATPTIIITNTKTKKVTKLEGTDEISEASILKAVKSAIQS